MEGTSCSSSSNQHNPCPICLGPIAQAQEAYLDHCFHKFCYKCILLWSKHVARHLPQAQSTLKCPLCRRHNFSIVYQCEGESFQRHYLYNDHVQTTFFSKPHKYRLFCYYREPPGPIVEKFNVDKFWKLRKYLQPNKWLQIWLRRELQALTQEEDVDIVVHHVLGLIESFMKQNKRGVLHSRDDFKALVYEAVKPFLIGRAERFVMEVELFLASGLNIEAYDEVYSQASDMRMSGTTGEEGEDNMQKEDTQVPYLYFFDGDSDTQSL